MITDYALRLCAYTCYLRYVSYGIEFISTVIHNILRRRFLNNEILYIKNQEGIILGYDNNLYYCLLKNRRIFIKCGSDKIQRKTSITKKGITDFLYEITEKSPFDCRLLRKGVILYICDTTNIRCYEDILSLYDIQRPINTNTLEQYIESHNECSDSSTMHCSSDTQITEGTLQEEQNSIENAPSSTETAYDCEERSGLESESLEGGNDSKENENEIKNGKQDNGRKREKHANIQQYSGNIQNKRYDIQSVTDNVEQLYGNDTQSAYENIFDIIPKSEIYSIADLDYRHVCKVLRIMSYVYSFHTKSEHNNMTAHTFLKQLNDSFHRSDIIDVIYKKITNDIFIEIAKLGFGGFMANIQSILLSVQSYDCNDTPVVRKEVGIRKWTQKTRFLLLDIYKNTRNSAFLCYYNVLKRKSPYSPRMTLIYRLEVLEFLVSIYMTTCHFRNVIVHETIKYREYTNRMHDLHMQKHTEQEIMFLKRKIITLPVKVDLGTLNSGRFILINKVIYIYKNNIIYLPSSNTIQMILHIYIPQNDTEVMTFNNIQDAYRLLYSIQD